VINCLLKKITRDIIQGSGLSPTLYTIMESNLHLKSSKNIIVKFVDDTTLVVPENSDVSLQEEFDHINVWATVNKMILNLIKTKETVFHRPGPKGFHMFPSVEGIELVEQVKLLGVILQNNLSVNSHVNYVLTLCSQRIFLLKRLRDQGLNYHQPDTVFRLL